MKTAMMQLLDRLNEKKDNSDWFHIDEITQVVMDEMVEIERQQLFDSWRDGAALSGSRTVKQYYNETYGNGKE